MAKNPEPKDKNLSTPVNPPKSSLAPEAKPEIKAETNMQSAKDKFKSRPKPLVEGINTPRTTNDVIVVKPTFPTFPSLTEEEKRLIAETEDLKNKQEPKFLSKAEIEKHHPVVKSLTIIVILAFLAIAGYWGYEWNLTRLSQTALDSTPAGNYSNSPNDYQAPVSGDISGELTASGTAPGILPNATSTPASSSPTSIVTQLKINATPTSYLNVRDLPSPSGKIITKAHPGEIYTYLSSKNGWYQISLPNGQIGWVSGQYITVQ